MNRWLCGLLQWQIADQQRKKLISTKRIKNVYKEDFWLPFQWKIWCGKKHRSFSINISNVHGVWTLLSGSSPDSAVLSLIQEQGKAHKASPYLYHTFSVHWEGTAKFSSVILKTSLFLSQLIHTLLCRTEHHHHLCSFLSAWCSSLLHSAVVNHCTSLAKKISLIRRKSIHPFSSNYVIFSPSYSLSKGPDLPAFQTSS